MVGRYPNHLWLADITRVRTALRFVHLHVAVVFDAFPRMPLQAAVFHSEPTAAAIRGFVQAAIREHGRPRHLVSDRGSQFIEEEFKTTLAALGIRQRFGALYRHGSIALVERGFRTLKEDLRTSAPGRGGPGTATTSNAASRRPCSATPTAGRTRPSLAAFPRRPSSASPISGPF